MRTSGIPFTRGPLAHLLRNRFYIAEVTFKGEILKGEQPAILDRDLFEAVQTKLSEQATDHKATRMSPRGFPLCARTKPLMAIAHIHQRRL
jgi:site-specific DNA recombinase